MIIQAWEIKVYRLVNKTEANIIFNFKTSTNAINVNFTLFHFPAVQFGINIAAKASGVETNKILNVTNLS
jgi:hypothetical protein